MIDRSSASTTNRCRLVGGPQSAQARRRFRLARNAPYARTSLEKSSKSLERNAPSARDIQSGNDQKTDDEIDAGHENSEPVVASRQPCDHPVRDRPQY